MRTYNSFFHIFRFIFSKICLFLLILFCFFSFGCTTANIAPDFPVKKCAEYLSCQVKDGLQVGIHVITDNITAKQYFGTDLLAKGIIPVLVVAENHNNSLSFISPYDKPEISLAPHNKKPETKIAIPDSGIMASDSAKKAVYEREIPGLIFEFVDYGPTEKSVSVQQNIILKSLKKKTLSPGEKQSGFLYLSLPAKIDQNVQLLITLNAMNLSLKKIEAFNFIFKLPKEIIGIKNENK